MRISDWSSDVCSSDLIEKAHPDLFNILLQVMDYGKMTDHNGKTVDFRNVILIMTTNAGAADMAKTAIGFARDERTGRSEEHTSDLQSLMRHSSAGFCLNIKKKLPNATTN